MTQKSTKTPERFRHHQHPAKQQIQMQTAQADLLASDSSFATLVIASMNNCHYKTLTNGPIGPLLGSKLADPANEVRKVLSLDHAD